MAGLVVECPTCQMSITIPTPETPVLQPPRVQTEDNWPHSYEAQHARPLDPIPPELPRGEGLKDGEDKGRRIRKQRIGLFALIGFVAIVLFRSFCGIFVVQPIGAIPDGGTIVYWRSGLNMPFIASADGLQQEYDGGVSLLGRGVILAGLTDMLRERKIVSLPYSKTLYLWSTGGREYDR